MHIVYNHISFMHIVYNHISFPLCRMPCKKKVMARSVCLPLPSFSAFLVLYVYSVLPWFATSQPCCSQPRYGACWVTVSYIQSYLCLRSYPYPMSYTPIPNWIHDCMRVHTIRNSLGFDNQTFVRIQIRTRCILGIRIAHKTCLACKWVIYAEKA